MTCSFFSIGVKCIVCVVLSVGSFSNNRLSLERKRVSNVLMFYHVCFFLFLLFLQVHPHEDSYSRMIELWFLFSLIWSICASVDEDSRKKMDNFLREIEGQFPAKVMLSSVYRSASKNFCLFVLIKW